MNSKTKKKINGVIYLKMEGVLLLQCKSTPTHKHVKKTLVDVDDVPQQVKIATASDHKI